MARKNDGWQLIARGGMKIQFSLPFEASEALIEAEAELAPSCPSGTTVTLLLDDEIVGRVQYPRGPFPTPVRFSASHREKSTSIRESHTLELQFSEGAVWVGTPMLLVKISD